MSKNEKLGSDGYSKKAFQAGLDRLDNSQILYQPPSDKRKDDPEWQTDTDAASAEDQKTVETLDRQYANAMRMAEKEELVVRIEKETRELNESINRVIGHAPEGVIKEANTVVGMGERLSQVLKSEQRQPRSLVEGLIQEFLKAKEYILSKLRKWLGTQDRFGGPPQPA